MSGRDAFSGGHRIFFAVVVLCLAICVGLLVASAVRQPDRASAQEVGALTPDEQVAAYAAEVEAQYEARQQYLASPAAQQQRDESASAFDDLSASQAQDVLGDKFATGFRLPATVAS